jgi:hypothetical protein
MGGFSYKLWPNAFISNTTTRYSAKACLPVISFGFSMAMFN